MDYFCSHWEFSCCEKVISLQFSSGSMEKSLTPASFTEEMKMFVLALIFAVFFEEPLPSQIDFHPQEPNIERFIEAADKPVYIHAVDCEGPGSFCS